jgi:dTDP-glucose pyrophosphorylase
LIVEDAGKFIGLLSAGDIQRAIIKGTSLESSVVDHLRRNIRVARAGDRFSDIKAMMLKFRMEFVPVVDAKGQVTHVHLWESVFSKKAIPMEKSFEVPVVIMAGGQGTRLKPITNIIPKPLVPIGEKPVIEKIIDSFQRLGVKDFYISVNYKADMLEFYFQQHQDPKRQLHFLRENQPLGTAGSLHLLKDKIDSTFFVSNCDILIDQDYSEIYKHHKSEKFQLTLVAALHQHMIPYGTVEIGDHGTLKALKEKPEVTYMINTGMYVLEPETLNLVPENEHFHMTELIQKVRHNGGSVGVFPISESSWIDIGQWAEYQKTWSGNSDSPEMV